MYMYICDTSHLKGNDIAVTACRLTSTKIVNEVLALRKKEAGKLLECSRFFYTCEMNYNQKLHSLAGHTLCFERKGLVNLVQRCCDSRNYSCGSIKFQGG